MLKKIFLISFLFAAFVSNAQFQKPIGYGFEYRRLVVDTLFAFPSDTFTIAANLKSYMWAARKGDSIYLWSPIQDKWVLNSGGSSGGGTDNINLGTFYRLLVPSSQGIKGIAPGYGTLWDSTTNANSLTSKFDSAAVFPQLRSTIFQRFGVTGEDKSFTANRSVNGHGLYGFQFDSLSYFNHRYGYNYSELSIVHTNPYEEANLSDASGFNYFRSAAADNTNSIFRYVAGGGAGNGNYYISGQSTNTFQKGQMGSSQNVDGRWIDHLWESVVSSTTVSDSHLGWAMEQWDGTALQRFKNLLQYGDSTGWKFQVWRTSGDASSGSGYKGIRIDTSSNVRFDNYPSSRNNGLTLKALHIKNSAGDIDYSYLDTTFYATKTYAASVASSGTINSGTSPHPAYYVGTTTLDDFTPIDYANSGTISKMTAQLSTDTVLKIVGATSQTGDYLTIRASNNTDRFRILSTGNGTSPGAFIQTEKFGEGAEANFARTTSFGFEAGNGNTQDGTFFGSLAGKGNTGTAIASFGFNAGLTNTGNASTFIGNQSGNPNTGTGVTFVGYRSGIVNSGNQSTGVGNQVLQNNNKSDATGVGYYALADNTGATSTAMGSTAGISNTGADLTAFGFSAGSNNTAANVTAIGSSAGLSNTGGSLTAVGRFAGYANSGANSTLVGDLAGLGNARANFTGIGANAATVNSNTHQMLLTTDGVSSPNYIFANGAGNIGFTVSAPTAKLHLPVGDGTANKGPLKFTTSGAGLVATPEAGLMEVLVDSLYWTGNSGTRYKIYPQTAYTGTATGITLDATHSTVNVTATGQTITLPTAVGITGRIYTIKLTASGSGTVGTTSSQTIDGSTTYSLASQYKYVTVQSTGANWIVIANN